MHAIVRSVDAEGQHPTSARFYLRIGNGNRAISDDDEGQATLPALGRVRAPSLMPGFVETVEIGPAEAPIVSPGE